ncbi:MAG: peptidase T [Clostridia bacterium]|nr:peptidase T [Clostridia bacterium]
MTVKERFLHYVSFYTTSDENSDTVPSTARQKALGQFIAEELNAMGVAAEMDAMGYVYGWLPPTPDRADEPAIGLIAHMDTAPDAPGDNIHPRSVLYQGGDIPLSDTEAIRAKDFECLSRYVGQELIVTDGATLLGADDKAGVAEIVTAVEYLTYHPTVSHRGVAVCFTPDEEIGRGADHFDYQKFRAPFAYTVDGGALGEIEYENFNAASVKVAVRGVNIHPGSAKNKMKNAALLACEFVSRLPPAETPAHTEGYEGFYHLTDLSGCEMNAEVRLIIRDHDREKFESRKAFVENLCAYLNTVYGAGTFTPEIKNSYYNMKEKILPHYHLIEAAEEAMRKAGAEPVTVPIRGGTDGARLSYEGLPCPNLSTGGENFHGVHEFVSVPAMETMVKVLVNLTA